MAKDTNYIVIVKQLEGGRFLLTFPDFEGITSTAEAEDTIQKVAISTIKTKLTELKKAGIEIAEPLKIKEVNEKLKDGEFTTFVSISNFNFDFKNLSNIANKEELKDGAKEIGDKIDKVIKEDIKNALPEGKENLLLIIAGVLSLLNTLFLSVLSVKIPFFGNFSIGFFRGLSDIATFAEDLKTASMALMFSGIILLIIAAGMIFLGVIRKRENIKYIVFSKFGFLLIFYIYLFIKIPNEAEAYISISFFKVFLYIISMGLAYTAYILMEKDEIKEN